MKSDSTNLLHAIFDEAVAIKNNSERDIFLADKCGENEELRSQLSRMFEALSEAGSFLEPNSQICFGVDGPHLFPNTKIPDAMQAEIEHIGVGTQIGSFHLTKELGAGGFGEVYLATQLEPIRRDVAIKLIKRGQDSSQIVGRFNAERQALAMMNHDSIAKIFDGGSTNSGRPYFVMEYVEGVSVTEYCDQYWLSIEARLCLFQKVCDAVHYAHQKGVLHRDIKPNNILVTNVNGIPQPKLIDFGIAKSLDAPITEDSVESLDWQFLGTPRYMSPEHATMGPKDLDVRSDVYSLGVVLYELLTGMTPLEQEKIKQSSLDEVFRMIREEVVPRPSERLTQARSNNTETVSEIASRRGSDAAILTKRLANDLDWIVLKSLNPERNQRYESASALATEMQRFLNGETVEAVTPTRVYRAKKFVQRNRVALALASAFLALILIGCTTSIWFGVQANRNATAANNAQFTAVQNAGKEREAKNEAIQERQKLELLFSEVDQLIDVSTEINSEIRREKLKAFVDRIVAGSPGSDGQSISEHPKLYVEYLQEWASAFNEANQYELGIVLLSKAVEIAQENFQPNERMYLDVMHSLLLAKYKTLSAKRSPNESIPDNLRSELQPSLDQIKKLIEYEKNLPDSDSKFARNELLLVSYLRFLGKNQEAIELMLAAADRLARTSDSSAFEVVVTRDELCRQLLYSNKRNEALDLAQKNFQWFQENKNLVNNKHRKEAYWNVLNTLALMKIVFWRHHEVINETRESVNLVEQILPTGKADARFPIFLKTHGHVLLVSQLPYETIKVFEESIDLIETYRQDHWNLNTRLEYVNAHVLLSDALIEVGQFNRAARIINKIPDFADGLLSIKEVPAGMTQWTKAKVFAELGQLEKAIELMETLRHRFTEEFGKNHPKTNKVTVRLASMLSAAKKFDEAIELKKTVLRNTNESALESLWSTRQKLGRTYVENGDFEEAIKLLQPAFHYYENHSMGKLNAYSPNRCWRVAKHLATASAETGEIEKGVALLKQCLDEQLEMYGRENFQSIDTRERLAKLYLLKNDMNNCLKHFNQVDHVFEELTHEIAGKWPDGWEELNIRLQWFDVQLDRIGNLKKFANTEADKLLGKMEPLVLKNYRQLTNFPLDDPLLKQEMVVRSLEQIMRVQEYHAKDSSNEEWSKKLEIARQRLVQ